MTRFTLRRALARGSALALFLVPIVSGSSEALDLESVVSVSEDSGVVRNELEESGAFDSLTLRATTRNYSTAPVETVVGATNQANGALAQAISIGDFAYAEAAANGSGEGDVSAISSSVSRPNQLRPGRATSIANARASGDGPVDVEATATGGTAIAASAHASGRSEGSGSVTVEATVNSQTAAVLPELTALAEGFSTGGGDVRVSSSVIRNSSGPPGESVVESHDAVSGSTAGTLTLDQLVATFGESIYTSLTSSNDGGGDLGVSVRAQSLPSNRPVPATSPVSIGDIRFGDVIGRANGAANVQVRADGLGRTIALATAATGGETARILGVSDSGAVEVEADFEWISPNAAMLSNGVLLGEAGDSVSLGNLVEGETTGDLTLRQLMKSADGAWLQQNVGLPQAEEGHAGAGGNATMYQARNGTHRSLAVENRAAAGHGGNVQLGVTFGSGGKGGDGESRIEARNLGGAVSAIGTALGGEGGYAISASGHGGDASVEQRAESFGDGNDVRVGRTANLNPDPRYRRYGAFAGDGGDSAFGLPSRTGTPIAIGHGGAATSRSDGRAYGNSEVVVIDGAFGGAGGNGQRFVSPNFSVGVGGRGGTASSSARAIGAGTSVVSAESHAIGGNGGLGLITGSDGGNSSSEANATGLGEVVARATAIGGVRGRADDAYGSAHARATAIGPHGQAVASARVGSIVDTRLGLVVSSELRSSVDVEATVRFGEMPALDPAADASAFFVGEPFAPNSGIVSEAGAAFGSTPGTEIRALGGALVRGLADEPTTHDLQFEITLAEPDDGGSVLLAVFDFEATAGGFESLDFGLELSGVMLEETRSFTDLASLRLYFGEVLSLGAAFAEASNRPPTNPIPGLRALFSIKSRAGQSLSFALGVAIIPEPSSSVLFGLGLTLLATTTRRETDSR